MGAARAYADDIEVGIHYGLGEYLLTAEEIADFADRWDPQTEAGSSVAEYFGGPIASGLHVLGIGQLLAVRTVYRDWAVVAGRGYSSIRFRSPARAGAVLRGDLEVIRVDLVDDTKGLVVVRQSMRDADALLCVADQELYLSRRPGPSGR